MTSRTLPLRDCCRGALRRTAIAALAGAMAFVPPAQACTSFLLRTSDGTSIRCGERSRIPATSLMR